MKDAVEGTSGDGVWPTELCPRAIGGHTCRRMPCNSFRNVRNVNALAETFISPPTVKLNSESLVD